jgi:signal transduction histidine kinase
MIASVVVIMLVAVLATYLFARRTLGPISALTDAAHQVAAGNTPEPVEVVGDTELSELAVAFNSMGDTLRHEDEARRRLTTDIAHELRSPLQNIRGTVESAQDGIRGLDEELLESLHEDTMMLQRLVDDLQVLALADASRLHLQQESVDVDELLELTFRRYSDRAVEKDIELYHVGTTAAVVFADPLRIRQVIANLLDNAIRHTQPKGQIELSAVVGANSVVISVRDTGEGIPEEFLPRFFDRFSRADPSRTRGTGGSGVGLAICQKLIEAHSGTISVDSSVGVGTTFRVTLPLEV